MKQTQIEKLAREYAANCGDAVAALRVVAPAMAKKSDAQIAAHFKRTYEDLPAFWRRVSELRAVVEKEIALTAQDVMTHWAMIATADASKISAVVIKPCAFCWREEPLPHPRIPNGKCQHCQGEGLEDVKLTPTARLGPAERMLYDGAERTKNGIKVHHRSRDKALENIARGLGMFTEKLQLVNNEPPPAPPLPDDPSEASRLYSQWIKRLDKP